MTSYVELLVDQIIQVITNEGRVFTGVLKSFDQTLNMVIKDCYEKVYSSNEGVVFNKMGLYMIRGDNVAIVAELNENSEKLIDYSKIQAEPLKEMKFH
jgi:U6 snRNA-associated Sm-like protein LSm8